METTNTKIRKSRDGWGWKAAVSVYVFAALVLGGVLVTNAGRHRGARRADAGGAGNKPAQTGTVPAPAPVRPASAGAPAAAVAPEPTAATGAAPKPATDAVLAPPVAPVSYADAEAAYFARDYALAAERFEGVAAGHPQSVMAHYMLGLSRWKNGQTKEAEAALRRALELDPEHVKSLTNLARVLLDDGRPSDALDPARRAAELDAESAEALRVRGRVYHNLGRTELAIESYEQAIVLDERDAWALNNLGLLLIEAGRASEAIAPLARATRVTGDIPVFHNNLGIALERTGHYRAAATAYVRAVECGGTSGAKAEVNLARVEGLKEEPGLAALDLEALGGGGADLDAALHPAPASP